MGDAQIDKMAKRKIQVDIRFLRNCRDSIGCIIPVHLSKVLRVSFVDLTPDEICLGAIQKGGPQRRERGGLANAESALQMYF